MRRFSVVAVLSMLCACNRAEPFGRVFAVASPDGARVAILREAEALGGALATTTFSIELRSAGEDSRLSAPNRVVWRGGPVAPMYFFWVDSETLEVLVRQEERERLPEFQKTVNSAVRVETRLVGSSQKAVVCGSAHESAPE